MPTSVTERPLEVGAHVQWSGLVGAPTVFPAWPTFPGHAANEEYTFTPTEEWHERDGSPGITPDQDIVVSSRVGARSPHVSFMVTHCRAT